MEFGLIKQSMKLSTNRKLGNNSKNIFKFIRGLIGANKISNSNRASIIIIIKG